MTEQRRIPGDPRLGFGNSRSFYSETFYGRCRECEASWTEDGARSLRCPECGSPDVIVSDEPPGAGADPFGRPDPRTHPEFWTE